MLPRRATADKPGRSPVRRGSLHNADDRRARGCRDHATLTPYPNPKNLQWEAVENIGKEQVLVIDSRNDPRAASAGAMLPTRMKMRAPPASSPTALSGTGRNSLDCLSGLCPPSGRIDPPIVSPRCRSAGPDHLRRRGGLSRRHHRRRLRRRHRHSPPARSRNDRCVRNRDRLEKYLSYRIGAGEPLYGVYPPTARGAPTSRHGKRPVPSPRTP